MLVPFDDVKFDDLTGTPICCWRRGEDLVLLCRSTFRGKQRIDVRVWTSHEGSYQASRKGISFSVEEWPELSRATKKLQRLLKETIDPRHEKVRS